MLKKYIKDIPYTYVKVGIDILKKQFFTVSWPEDIPTVVTDTSPNTLDTHLRENEGFEGLYLSYNYTGQDLDLRKPDGLDNGDQMEVHLRARVTDRGTEVIGHREKSRYEHKADHINEVGYEVLDKHEIQDYLP